MSDPDHTGTAVQARSTLREELSTLTTESIDESLSRLDSLATEDLVRAMNVLDQTVPATVAQEAASIAAAVDAIVDRMRTGGRLIYVGAGTPGRLGVTDASECPPTFSTDPNQVVGLIAGGDPAIRTSVEGAEDDDRGGAADLAALDLVPADVVVGVSASGRTPYVAGALRYANDVGALTIAHSCNRDSVIGAIAQLAIETVVGPEFIAGSTRLKAGTAQKLVLNMLSTLTMVRLGKTYGNVMVDLQLTNEKLHARAERTMMTVAGISPERAAARLAEAGGSVKQALLAEMGGLSAGAARLALERSGGHLREALAASRSRPVDEPALPTPDPHRARSREGA